jgi:hypothetical protein
LELYRDLTDGSNGGEWDRNCSLLMITAVIISMIYNYVSEHIRILRLTSMPKGIGTGILAGVVEGLES